MTITTCFKFQAPKMLPGLHFELQICMWSHTFGLEASLINDKSQFLDIKIVKGRHTVQKY